MAWSDRTSKPLPPGVFDLAQTQLKARGKLTDPCAYCGCERQAHLPDPYFSYSKTGSSSGKTISVPVLAPTCCDKCPTCLDDCTAFVEPNGKNPKMRCAHVAAQKTNRAKRRRRVL